MLGARPRGTKLLVATVGLATVTYAGCGNSHPPGNLMAPPDPTTEEFPPGNLMAPPDRSAPVEPTATIAIPASGAPSSTVVPVLPTEMPHGNLMAPPPPPLKK